MSAAGYGHPADMRKLHSSERREAADDIEYMLFQVFSTLQTRFTEKQRAAAAAAVAAKYPAQQLLRLPAELLQKQQQAHLLLSTVLLYWAAQCAAYQPAAFGSYRPTDCSDALKSIFVGIGAVIESVETWGLAQRLLYCTAQPVRVAPVLLSQDLVLQLLQDMLPQAAAVAQQLLLQLNNCRADSSDDGSAVAQPVSSWAGAATSSVSIKSGTLLLQLLVSLKNAAVRWCTPNSNTPAGTQHAGGSASAPSCSSSTMLGPSASGSSTERPAAEGQWKGSWSGQNPPYAAVWVPYAVLFGQLEEAMLRIYGGGACKYVASLSGHFQDGQPGNENAGPQLAAALSAGPGSMDQRQLFSLMVSTAESISTAWQPR